MGKSFKVKPIRKEKNLWKKCVAGLGKKGAYTALGILILLLLLTGISIAIKHGGIEAPRNLFSTGPLKVDKYGKTNFLLLGVAGFAEEGGNLSDSVMLVSLDSKAGSLSMLSLPRDLFIASDVGDRKLNEIYAIARYKNNKNGQKGLSIVKDAVGRFAGIDIHYGAVVDFNIFEEIVDAIGGIDIFVPQDIVDPFYPADNYDYQTFTIRKGKQNIDGATALKYARSRKTTSDYSRAKRQQDILYAVADKARSINLLSDPKKVKEFFQIYKKNVVTDINLVEMLALAKVGIGLDSSDGRIINRVLNDDPYQPGGLLYTPAKEFFGGQFVLLPESLEDTQLFMHLTLSEPELLLSNPQFSVMNGSKITGQAGRVRDRLRRLGFHVIEVGNHESDRPVFQTYVRLHKDNKDTRKVVEELGEDIFKFLKVDTVPETEIPENDLVDIEIVLGSTYEGPRIQPILPVIEPKKSDDDDKEEKEEREEKKEREETSKVDEGETLLKEAVQLLN